MSGAQQLAMRDLRSGDLPIRRPHRRQSHNRVPVPACQRQLLGPRPTLDLPLGRERLIAGVEGVGEDQGDWEPFRGVAAVPSPFVFRQPHIEILRMPDLDRAIGAPEHVYVERHPTVIPSLILREPQDERKEAIVTRRDVRVPLARRRIVRPAQDALAGRHWVACPDGLPPSPDLPPRSW